MELGRKQCLIIRLIICKCSFFRGRKWTSYLVLWKQRKRSYSDWLISHNQKCRCSSDRLPFCYTNVSSVLVHLLQVQPLLKLNMLNRQCIFYKDRWSDLLPSYFVLHMHHLCITYCTIYGKIHICFSCIFFLYKIFPQILHGPKYLSLLISLSRI